MKAAQRDELLIRIDERVKNINEKTEQQEQHLAKINDHLDSHEHRLTVVETKQKMSKKQIAGYISGAAAVAAALAKSFIK